MKLNPNQKLFCELYAGGKGEFFGNATWCYILAYKLKVPLIPYSKLDQQQKKTYDNARSDAAQLVAKGNIQERCNELIDSLIKDSVVDRELAKVILQNKELSAKVSAIREYNALKGRIKNSMDITVKVEKLEEIQKATQDILNE